MAEKFPEKTVIASLNSQTVTTLLAAPPDTETAYRVRKVMGQNSTGGASSLQLILYDGTTNIVVWQGVAVADGESYTQSALGAEVFEFGIVLSATTHTLKMKASAGTTTNKIVCTYEILEAK